MDQQSQGTTQDTNQGTTQGTWYESIKVQGGQVLDQVSKLIHEGNVRRIIIKQDGRVIAEFPLTIGVVGALFAPVLAAVGAIAALIAECTIEVERTGEPPSARQQPPEQTTSVDDMNA